MIQEDRCQLTTIRIRYKSVCCICVYVRETEIYGLRAILQKSILLTYKQL